MSGGRVDGWTSYVARSTYLSAKGFVVRQLKQGPGFAPLLKELERSQWATAEELRHLQDERLQRIVRHAVANVPYYTRLFREAGLSPQDICTVEDLKKIPLLTKADLRAHARDLVARTTPRWSLFPGWTTGSTGTPVNALRTRTSILFESAMIWRQRRWAGIPLNARRAAVWGTVWNNVILPARTPQPPPYWRYNAADKQLLLSYYHMSDATLPLYFQKLREFQPAFIEGFPSTVLILARFLEARNTTLRVGAVFTSSEPLYPLHREIIEERFQTKVFDLYGQAERVVAATECERHEGLHVNPEYGVLELLRDGKDAPPGETGEIVGTSLTNEGMPLLRYQTGDLARWAGRACSCGRAMPLLEAVEGRTADALGTPDGRIIPGDGLMGAFHGIANIRNSQIVQEDRGHVVVRVVKDDPGQPVDTKRLVANLARLLGRSMVISCELVDQIPLEKGGKYRWVVSRVQWSGNAPQSSDAPGTRG